MFNFLLYSPMYWLDLPTDVFSVIDSVSSFSMIRYICMQKLIYLCFKLFLLPLGLFLLHIRRRFWSKNMCSSLKMFLEVKQSCQRLDFTDVIPPLPIRFSSVFVIAFCSSDVTCSSLANDFWLRIAMTYHLASLISSFHFVIHFLGWHFPFGWLAVYYLSSYYILFFLLYFPWWFSLTPVTPSWLNPLWHGPLKLWPSCSLGNTRLTYVVYLFW